MICQVYATMLKYSIENGKGPRGRSFAYLLRNAAWLCNLKLQTGKQFFKSLPLYSIPCQVIEIHNKRVSVFAVICLVKIRFCLAWWNV